MSHKFITNSISGIWNSYGCPPTEGEAICISLEQTPNTNIVETGSLLDLCGLKEEQKDIGRFRDYNYINELVVMLPMIRPGADLTGYFPPLFPQQPQPEADPEPCACVEDPCGHKNAYSARTEKISQRNNMIDFFYSIQEDAYLFKIKEELINKILNVSNYKQYNIFQIKDILSTRKNVLNIKNNIVRLMFVMTAYNFPPHLNWLLNTNLPSLAMYAAEYSMGIYKEDLSDIWQGTMPQQARNVQPEMGTSYIDHFLTDDEIFGGYDLNEYDDVKLKIFKCKWRSDGEYNSLINGKEVIKDPKKWYGYNWPYDYCSIVELLQVEQSEIHDYENSSSSDTGILKPGFTDDPLKEATVFEPGYAGNIGLIS